MKSKKTADIIMYRLGFLIGLIIFTMILYLLLSRYYDIISYKYILAGEIIAYIIIVGVLEAKKR